MEKSEVVRRLDNFHDSLGLTQTMDILEFVDNLNKLIEKYINPSDDEISVPSSSTLNERPGSGSETG